jgi:hypothetical protein
MKALVCGSRSWRDAEPIRARLRELPRGAAVMHGGARGADQLAGTVAAALGLEVVEYPADWRGLGRSAGLRRNLAMLDEQPDVVLAFWDGRSSGTAHVIVNANRRGIPLEVVFAIEGEAA